MASQSPEWYAMVECHDKLTLALSADTLNISGQLFAKKIISSDTHEKMSLSGITSTEKANFLVGAVRAAAESSEQKFRDFIEVLSEQPLTEDIAKTLRSTYEDHLSRAVDHNSGTSEVPKEKDSPEYSLVTLWSEVFTNTVSQNVMEISEALLKEALISSDIMDQVMTVDYTPLKKAEILCQALIQEIKEDANVLYKFTAVLSTIGRNKLLIRTLNNFLPRNEHTKVEENINDEEMESTDSDDMKLVKAILDGDTEHVRHLLQLGAIKINRFIKFDEGSTTALEAACANGHDEIVELLIKYGADVNKKGKTGMRPLNIACRLGRVETVKKLLNSGASVDIDVESSDPYFALLDATRFGRTDIVKILLEHGVSAGLHTIGRYTAMISACTDGLTEIAKLLLEYGAPVNEIADDGSFSIDCASRYGHADIVELLLQNDAQIDLQNRDGNTALISACIFGHTKVVKVLLEHRANTNLIAKNGDFALKQASAKGHYAIVKLLIKHNAPVNMANKAGMTALMSASIYGRFSIAKALLEAGADPRIMMKDTEACTAIAYAEKAGHIHIVNLLQGKPTIKEAFIALLPLAAKWKTIGFLLDLNDQLLALINSCSTDEEALKFMLRMWLGTSDPNPTWEALADAIEPLDENIAKKLTSLCN